MPNSKPQPDDTSGDPFPLRGGVCDEHGEFNNFSGRCMACMDQWMKDAMKATEIEVTTPSGFKILLQDAGYDKFGNRMWRELRVTVGGDA